MDSFWVVPVHLEGGQDSVGKVRDADEIMASVAVGAAEAEETFGAGGTDAEQQDGKVVDRTNLRYCHQVILKIL
jgi:hypothetical protein